MHAAEGRQQTLWSPISAVRKQRRTVKTAWSGSRSPHCPPLADLMTASVSAKPLSTGFALGLPTRARYTVHQSDCQKTQLDVHDKPVIWSPYTGQNLSLSSPSPLLGMYTIDKSDCRMSLANLCRPANQWARRQLAGQQSTDLCCGTCRLNLLFLSSGHTVIS